MKPTKEQARFERVKKQALAFLLSKPNANYDDSCASLSEVVGSLNIDQLFSPVEVHDALDSLREAGLVEYHRPRNAAAYWRASNQARREAAK